MNIVDINCECLGLSRLSLMESAGKSLAEEVGKIAIYNFSKPVKISIFTGSGGNGGDGFVAARYLLNRGFEVELFMLTPPQNIKDKNAKTNYEILENLIPRLSHLKITVLDTIDDIAKNREEFSHGIIIDAILGTGIKGKLREKVKTAIELINNAEALRISVDVPSGLNPLTGEISDIAVKPEYTISFHKVKTGVKKAGEELVGGSVICDIGIPLEAEYYTGVGDLLYLNRRSKESHKGNNGKVLIVGGSKKYSGAPAIAGLSAIASGADLVYIAAPTSASLAIKATSPDFIVEDLEGDYLAPKHTEKIMELTEKVDAVLIGPGGSLNEETGKLFNILASKIKKPLVIDADALKTVDFNIIKNKKNVILTPHIFEFKSFFKINNEDLKLSLNSNDFRFVDENITAFQNIVREIKGTVIIKGEYDLIVNLKKFKINRTGNSGMTVGGTGDALAGLSVSLLSQGIETFNAATLAIYLNGRAGDAAMNKQGYGFSATDLISYIGPIMISRG